VVESEFRRALYRYDLFKGQKRTEATISDAGEMSGQRKHQGDIMPVQHGELINYIAR
jgi:hypothetical protein